MNLAIVTNILTPYRIPLFEALRQRASSFLVLLMAAQEENRQWGLGKVSFQTRVLPGLHVRLPGHAVSLHLNHGVMRALRAFSPDVVVNAGFGPANIAAFVYCKLFRKKVVGWAHLTLQDGAQLSAVKRMIRRVLIRGSDGSIAESSDARDSFLSYGAKADRVLTALMPLEVQRLRDQTRLFRDSAEGRALRARFSGPVILSIGQAILRKGYPEMFLIYERLLTLEPSASLVLVGDGPLRTRYEQLARERGWRNVHFEGYVQAEDLHRYLAVADVFVFHTLYDPFGLVLSEAMAAGVPAVASVYASSTRDLITEGVTGMTIDPRETDTSAAAIVRVLQMPAAERDAMVACAQERVQQCDAPSAAERMARFLDSLQGFAHKGGRRAAAGPTT